MLGVEAARMRTGVGVSWVAYVNSNIEYLISSIAEIQSNAWVDYLSAILKSSDVEEVYNNPQLHLISFILTRARMRRANSANFCLETFGLESLIVTLENLPADGQLNVYGIKNGSYAGSCFVFSGALIGCELVARGLSKSVQFGGW